MTRSTFRSVIPAFLLHSSLRQSLLRLIVPLFPFAILHLCPAHTPSPLLTASFGSRRPVLVQTESIIINFFLYFLLIFTSSPLFPRFSPLLPSVLLPLSTFSHSLCAPLGRPSPPPPHLTPPLSFSGSMANDEFASAVTAAITVAAERGKSGRQVARM